MDLPSLIAGTLSSLTSSVTLAKAAIDVHNFTEAGAAVADVTQKLLNLQTQVIASNGEFMKLQEQHSALTQTVRELQEQLADFGRYSLFELSPGVLVYRSNIPPEPAGAENKAHPEPIHYLCPRCFHQKTKALLKLSGVHWNCTNCRNTYWTGQQERSIEF